MKPLTPVFLALRNVGDSQQTREAAEAVVQMTCAEALALIIRFVKETSMATRFQFALARTREEAIRGIGLGNATNEPGASWLALDQSLRDLLDNLGDDESSEGCSPAEPGTSAQAIAQATKESR